MVKSVFAKITDAKRFLCFLIIKNTPTERESHWGNHKYFRSTTITTTSAATAASAVVTTAAEMFVVTPGTFPFSWSVFSRDEATLYERVFVRWSVGPLIRGSVRLSLFGILGATYGRVSGLVYHQKT